MRNQLTNSNIEKALEMLKQETAAEMGIELGAEQTSKLNGSVGGNITKKLISLGELKLVEMMNEQGIGNVELTKYIDNQGNPPTYDQLH